MKASENTSKQSKLCLNLRSYLRQFVPQRVLDKRLKLRPWIC